MSENLRNDNPGAGWNQRFDGLIIRAHEPGELAAVARMNKELLEDEESRNPMNVVELLERLVRFVDHEGWTVELFTVEGEIVGYITYRYESNIVSPDGRSMHLRQFYIARHHRRQGLGAAAIALFKRSRLNAGERIHLDVLETNPEGKKFWRSVGFVPYATVMESSA